MVAGTLAVRAQSYSTDDAAAVMQSYTLEGKGDYDGAIKQMTGRGVASTDYFFELRLGWLYYLKGAYATASTHYENAIAVRPQAADANVGLMNCAYALKEYKKTAATAKSMMKNDPANYYANLYLVLVDLASQNYGAAELHSTAALKFYPTDLKLNLNLAYTYIYQARKDDAKAVANLLTTVFGSTNTDVAALWSALQ